jgi:hypothetical protein
MFGFHGGTMSLDYCVLLSAVCVLLGAVWISWTLDNAGVESVVDVVKWVGNAETVPGGVVRATAAMGGFRWVWIVFKWVWRVPVIYDR